MIEVTAGSEMSVTPPRRARLTLPEGWPIYVTFFGFPVLWVLGVSQLIYPALAIPMVWSLVRHNRTRPVRLPAGFSIWLLFVLWSLVTVLVIHDSHKLFSFGYRASLYLSATVYFLYTYNRVDVVLPRRRIIAAVAFLWAFTIFGGYLGMLDPRGSISTPMGSLLPGRLQANPLVHLMVHPGFSQVQNILGFRISQPRPAAPYLYTDEWGACLAVLTPFAFAAAALAKTHRQRLMWYAGLGIGLVPIVFSLTRGLWLALGAIAIYSAIRFALRGRVTALVALVAALILGAGIVAATPLQETVSTRLTTHTQSNAARSRLYSEVIRTVATSPAFGFATPLPPGAANEAAGSGTARGGNAAIGTQGQLWLVLYSHGYPGAVTFVAWFLFAWWRTRKLRSPAGFWCHVSLLAGLVIVAVYTFLPVPILVMMVAAGIGMRERDGLRRSGVRPHPATSVPDPRIHELAAVGR